jgi:hypothetical protein
VDGRSDPAAFPEDAPRSFQMAVAGCQDVSVTDGADPQPSERRVFTFTVPTGAEVLRVAAAWRDTQRKRRLSVGPGTCPPCDATERAKGYGDVLLELPALPEHAGRAWFAAMEGDPAEDDLGIEPPRVEVQACRIAADGGPRGLFPTEGLDQGSQSVLEHHAFGMQGFDGVRIATYHDGKLLAFVAVFSSADEARDRAGAYRTHLTSLGGEPMAVEGLSGAEALRTHGLTTILFTRGTYLGGVQEAADSDEAAALATLLADWLVEG